MKNKPADIPYGGLNPTKIGRANPTINPEMLEIFKHYVTERYNIHILKDIKKQPYPWTEDIFLSMYKFTNVRREHDKNSRYLLQKMKEHGNLLSYNMLGNILVFRLFNKIETFELLGGWIDFENYNEELIRHQLSNVPKGYVYFTNAYLSSGMKRSFNRYNPQEKMRVINIPNVVNQFLTEMYEAVLVSESPQDIIEALKIIDGISNFISYQLFVDMTYLDNFPWSENEFVMSGIGCELGLSYLFDDRDGLSSEELLFWLRDNCPITREWCMKHMTDLPEEDRYMNVMSLENCMCEFGKYMKTKLGVGRPRSRYKIGGN